MEDAPITVQARPWLVALAAWLLLLPAACTHLVVSDAAPLPASRLNPPGSEVISRGGYRLAATFQQAKAAPDLLVLVAMSGGGKRSAAYAFGALRGMRALPVLTPGGPKPLLDEVDVIAGVSGGSFTAAYYGLYREAAFDTYADDFLYQDTTSYIYGVYLLPWHWTWLVDPSVGTNDFMDRVYDRTLFHGATYETLLRRGRPIIAIGATDISYGTPFLFIQDSFDLICADLSVFPLSRAVAASNGFPGLFSPVTLTSHAAACGGRTPAWLDRVTPAQRADPLSRVGEEARNARLYLDPASTKYLHLADGGVSDNLALRAGGAAMQRATLGVSPLAARAISRIRRVLVLSIDGEGAQDTTVAQKQLVGGLFSLLSLVSGAQIDRYNFETLTTVQQQAQEFAAAIKALRCAPGWASDGAPCDDVRAALIHVSLLEAPRGPERDALLAIPTGLTIAHDDVDALIAAGAQAIRTSPQLHDFLADYPRRPAK